MAGVQPLKTNVKALASMGAHFDEDRRKMANHRNQEIDRSKSEANYNIGANSWREIISKCKRRVEELDGEIPLKTKPRADRKTAYVFVIYCPPELEGQDQEFFAKVYMAYEKEFPGSLYGIQVHKDEKHEYLDPITKQLTESKIHGHCFGVPSHCEKGCNMKAFMDRTWFVKVNKICEDVANEMGAKYHTGKGHHSGRSVEQMKVESSKVLEEKIKEQQKENEKLINDNFTLELANQENQDELQKVQEEVFILRNEVQVLKNEKNALRVKIKQIKEDIQIILEWFEELAEKALKRHWGDLFKQRKAEAAVRKGRKEEETIQDYLNNNDLECEVPVNSVGNLLGSINKLEELEDTWERD